MKCPGNCGNLMTADVQYLSSEAVPSNCSVQVAAPQSAAGGIVQGV
jgi:hypothetical protein